MFSKNLKSSRILAELSQDELAKRVGVTADTITRYENAEASPDSMELINKLAKALNISPLEFLRTWNSDLEFHLTDSHSSEALHSLAWSRNGILAQQYLQRLFEVIDLLGSNTLPAPARTKEIKVRHNDPERMAQELRTHLGIPASGPIHHLTHLLESSGILTVPIIDPSVQFTDSDGQRTDSNKQRGDTNNQHASLKETHADKTGPDTANGMIGEYPFILYKQTSDPLQIRIYLVNELIDLMFDWKPADLQVKAALTETVAASFLLPQTDLLQQTGKKRRHVGRDMLMTAQKYQISPQRLIRQAASCGILCHETAAESEKLLKKFPLNQNTGNRLNPASSMVSSVSHLMSSSSFLQSQHSEEGAPTLLERLVMRAWSEEEIGLSKAAELLSLSLPETRQRLCLNIPRKTNSIQKD